MVKHDREFEILLKEFLETEGKHFSSREEATEVFERIYNLVDEGYKIDAPLSDFVDAIDEGDMSAVDKINALRELHEENRDALDRAVELEEDILYSDNDEDTEQMLLADALAGYYSEAGMNEQAAKLFELMLMANPSDFHEVIDLLTLMYVRLDRESSLMNHIDCFDYEESEAALLLLSIFGINQEKFDEAQYYMMKLKKLNECTGNIFKGGFNKVLDYIEGTPDFEKGANKEKSFEMHFAAGVVKEYLTNKYHYELLEKFYREDMEKKQILIVEGRKSASKEVMKEDPVFKGMEKQLNKFINVELYNKEIIECYTEKELKKLDGIGVGIIKKLKDNGVKFKEE
ncbi:hypothetical protein [uncultured Gemella sp.]|uniref:hypothetical protein n=1 Tax=uncultured Gemella sp. TaxID=254352 RepID=UPI0028D5E6F1|nr:hypothetical protein [uncultured Gemella sp.]